MCESPQSRVTISNKAQYFYCRSLFTVPFLFCHWSVLLHYFVFLKLQGLLIGVWSVHRGVECLLSKYIYKKKKKVGLPHQPVRPSSSTELIIKKQFLFNLLSELNTLMHFSPAHSVLLFLSLYGHFFLFGLVCTVIMSTLFRKDAVAKCLYL